MTCLSALFNAPGKGNRFRLVGMRSRTPATGWEVVHPGDGSAGRDRIRFQASRSTGGNLVWRVPTPKAPDFDLAETEGAFRPWWSAMGRLMPLPDARLRTDAKASQIFGRDVQVGSLYTVNAKRELLQECTVTRGTERCPSRTKDTFATG